MVISTLIYIYTSAESVPCFVLYIVMYILCINLFITAEFNNPRSLFSRSVGFRLSSVHSDLIVNTSVTTCSLVCLTTTPGRNTGLYTCKSFDYDNAARSCYLFSVCLSDKDVRQIQSSGRDHYESTIFGFSAFFSCLFVIRNSVIARHGWKFYLSVIFDIFNQSILFQKLQWPSNRSSY